MMARHGWRLLLGSVAAVLALATAVWALNRRDEPDLTTPSAAATRPVTPELIAKGSYLARAGNCFSCHTSRGGAAYAGGRGIDTPFGTVYSSNLTPDATTGLGRWTPAAFWRAMHNGRSADGRLLYPAFPYTSFTRITREDSDALFAFLQSLPPQHQPATAHSLRWPYNSQAALAVWRALYFTPGATSPQPARSAEWNRGAYLVNTLGHCNACHSTRNALGASGTDFAGGDIPMQNWYAPSLTSATEASVADWAVPDIVTLLKTGVAPSGQHASHAVSGPMAEVVQHSTQHLNDPDLTAMATFLQALPPVQPPVAKAPPPPTARVADRGAKLYEQYCVQCHGAQGQGELGAYPRLAGNRAVMFGTPTNLVQMVLYGGFPPTTAGNPRPFGMPPFVLVLNDADLAAVLTHVRTAWGNRAAPVSELDVSRLRDR
jgi:mono/diheme cytochrome c family protein